MKGCNNLRYKLEDYIGPLDGLTVRPDIAEKFAKENGFIQLSTRKWCCPSCAAKFGYSNGGV